MVSHELRTPLHAVLGWAELIKEGDLPAEKIKKGIDTIERNARTQARLVEDMLDVSRIIAGKIRLDLKPIDPAHTVESAVDVLRPTAQAKRIDLALETNSENQLVFGDAARLQQVVWNLVANALKFTPSGGLVSVRLVRNDRFLELVVKDNGKGIPQEMLPFVFDRFWQAETGARTQPGLGLGLAITRNLVELHGGAISVSSEGLGFGATFTVRLPIVNGSERLGDNESTDASTLAARGPASGTDERSPTAKSA